MAGEQLILLGFWPSPFVMRARFALAEKGINYEYREENVSDNKSPLLLKMNPVKKQVPVLIHNDKPVCESLLIIQYIDEVWSNDSPLLPFDPHHRAHARFWADYVDKKIHPLLRQVWFSPPGEALEEAKNELIKCFKLLEGELGDNPYFGGETFGFADVALISFYSWFHTTEQCGNFSIEAECPKLIAWAHRCMKKESVSMFLPDKYKVHEFFIDIKKKLAVEIKMKLAGN